MSVESTQSAGRTLRSNFLIGRYEHALDVKRRIIVPAVWRDVMGEPKYVYIIPNPEERCLSLVSPVEMELRMDRLRQNSLFDKKASAQLRHLGENSEQVMLDVQGRIRIRDRLLAFANLTDKVVLIGMGMRAEIWSSAMRPESAEIDQSNLVPPDTEFVL